MKSWDELSRKEQLASIHYDAYKDVHGVRPRWFNYDEMSEADLEKELELLSEQAEVVFAEEQALQQEAIKVFEARVAETVAIGADSRETAIRWIADAEDVNDDLEYLCFKVGLPYGYFKEAA